MVIKYLIETFFVQMVIFWKCVSEYLNIKIKLLHYFGAKNLWEYCSEHCLVRFWVLRFNLLLSSMSIKKKFQNTKSGRGDFGQV